MQLTQATDYAFRAVLYLTRVPSEEFINAQLIAEKEEIPMRFLLKIMRSLIKAGIVKSHRGVGGGYSLNKTPREITLLDVVEAVEGPVVVNRCLISPQYCSKNWSSQCAIHRALFDIQNGLVNQLAKYNFWEIAKNIR
ncbi:MAG: RrF2 family transcriptional regulator [Bacillota bacterium]